MRMRMKMKILVTKTLLKTVKLQKKTRTRRTMKMKILPLLIMMIPKVSPGGKTELSSYAVRAKEGEDKKECLKKFKTH